MKYLLTLLIFFSTSVFSELTGKAKESWEKSYIPACIKMATDHPVNKNISKTEIEKYCHCASDHISERATVSDVNKSTDKMVKIVNDAMILCTGKLLIERGDENNE